MRQKFINTVSKGDVFNTRLYLSNELMLDPRGRSFNEMKSYAEENISELYDCSDGKGYDTLESDWNEDFLCTLKNDLDSNFSRERLDLYEKVAKVVLHKKAEQLDKEEADRKSHQESSHIEISEPVSSSSNSSKKKIAVGLTVGGAAVTIAGLCLEKIALTSLGVVGLAIGGVLLYNETKK